ncbi:MAG: cytochrome bc complex cytochrome b subunit [Anaerolineae bacterium]|nr:cytochrome bc complex cytochrome b subunit [Anaerolineae bacterium]MDW8172639.1 cytochrome bc complex cytochrome b subunit [Anaerolineae bacterium]
MSILPFPSFLDDVKEKGFRKALMEGIDQTVERLTAGMNIQDIREALRGDPPSRRPNPRLSPHADSFWLHMRPGYFHRDMTGIYPTFRLGWLSTYFVVFETITGILLMFWYTPSPDIAYGNMLNILSNVPLGQFVRDLHRLGAEAMVLIVALHMMRTWITGSYKKPRQFTWFTGVILLVLTGLLSFTGYLLPWDQLALWAVTIGASMAEATPVIGEQVNLIVRGAPELGANGLLRFYLAHVLLLPVFLFIFTGVHYYKVIIHGHSLPPRAENIGEDTAKRVPLDKRVYFIPDILTNEIMWIGMTTFIMVVLCVWFYHAPLENHADPQVTPLGTTAPWYFLWIQGALKLGDKFFWGILFPTLMIGILAVMPYIDLTKSRRYAHRRVSLSLAMALVSFATILSYMGLPEFAVSTSAEIEILHEMTMEPAHNHVGKMRTVPYAQLVPGAYTTAQIGAADPRAAVEAFNAQVTSTGQYAQMRERLLADHAITVPSSFRVVPDDAPALKKVLEFLHHHIEARHKELPNAWGAIIIAEAQSTLKRVDIVISWDGVHIENGVVQTDANGQPLFLTTIDANGNEVVQRRVDAKHVFLHPDSAYFD